MRSMVSVMGRVLPGVLLITSLIALALSSPAFALDIQEAEVSATMERAGKCNAYDPECTLAEVDPSTCGLTSSRVGFICWTTPRPVKKIDVRTGNSKLLVEWEIDKDAFGPPNREFWVWTSPPSSECRTKEYSCTLDGLTNDQEYEVFLKVRKSGYYQFHFTCDTDIETKGHCFQVYDSEVRISSRVKPTALPHAPTVTKAEWVDDALKVEWAMSEPDLVDNFTVTVSDNPVNCVTPEFECVLEGLSGDEDIEVRIAASRQDQMGGVSEPYVVRALRVVPASPRSLNVRVAGSTAAISWKAGQVTLRNNSPQFVVTLRPGGQVCLTSQRKCLVKGLKPGQRFKVEVIARNSSGSSVPVRSAQIVIPKKSSPTKPTKPSNAPTKPSPLVSSPPKAVPEIG